MGAQYFMSTTPQKTTCIWPPTHIRQYVVPGTSLRSKDLNWKRSLWENIYIQRFAPDFLDFSKIADLQSSYRATRWRAMSFVDQLFLKNCENVSEIFEYIFSWSERYQFKSLFLGGGGGPCGQMWVGGQIHVILWVVDVTYWAPTDWIFQKTFRI